MSMATNAKSAKARATIAANMLKKNWTFGRSFDDCFEMGDGDQVMNYLIEKTKRDKTLANNILLKMPELGTPEANMRLHDAIKECSWFRYHR